MRRASLGDTCFESQTVFCLAVDRSFTEESPETEDPIPAVDGHALDTRYLTRRVLTGRKIHDEAIRVAWLDVQKIQQIAGRSS